MSAMQICYKMYKKEGILSFFKGIEASLFLVINPIIQFIIYEFLKKKLKCENFFSFLSNQDVISRI